jgi:1,4-dihydroxy-2-naphthoyl-CoA hydrolase
MSIWQFPIDLKLLNERSANTMGSLVGIEFTEFGDDFLCARMPVDDRTRQPLGIMHGGASCVLAETVGSTGANYCVDYPAHYCVGLDINTNHIRAIRSGYVYGRAKPFHLGRTTQVWGIEITNEAGKLISVTRLTMAVLKREEKSL